MAEHARRGAHQRARSHGRAAAGIGGAVVAVGAGAFVAVAHARAGTSPGHALAPHARVVHHVPAARAGGAPTPLGVVGVSPGNGAAGVRTDATVAVTFSAPLAADDTPPTLAPAIDGSWRRAGNRWVFTPSRALIPGTRVTVTVPAGERGLAGGSLASATTTSFTVAPGSPLRLEQLLAQLGYLPLDFSTPLASESKDAADVSLSPEPGSFTWRYADTPAQLRALWVTGEDNEIVTGAVMAFESDHGLATDGVAGPQVWGALLAAVAGRERSQHPYDYVIATETLPETLYVWSNGQTVLHSPVNTGVPGATTPTGTWPVYLRYTSTTMVGTDPNGVHYDDPGIPWVSYFNGSIAVHGYVRSGYGYPQSNGCLELPVPVSAQVYPLDPIGTLVTVTTGSLGAEMLGAGTPAPSTTPPAPTATTAPTTTVPTPSSTSTSTTVVPATSTTAPPPSSTSTTIVPSTTSAPPG